MNKKIKGFYQYNQEDCGAACLKTILYYFDIYTSISALKLNLSYDKQGASIYSIIQVAIKYGVRSEALKVDLDELIELIETKNIRTPMILHTTNSKSEGHYIILKRVRKRKFYIFDPAEGNLKMSYDEIISKWTGVIIHFSFNDSRVEKSNKKNLNLSRYRDILYKERKGIISAVLISFIISMIIFSGSWIYKIIIDDYILNLIPSSNVNLGIILLFLFILYIFQSIMLFVNNILIAKLSRNLSNELSKSFLQHLLHISEKSISYFESGEILSRFESISQIQNAYLQIILTFTSEIINMFIGATILIHISFKLFVFVFIIIILYVIIFSIFLPFIRNKRKKYYTHYSESITILNQVLDGRSTILMSKSVSFFFYKIFDKVLKSNDDVFKINLYNGSISTLVTLTELIGGLLILWQGSNMVVQGMLSLGSLIIFQNMVSNFISPVQQLVSLQDDIQNISILKQRLDDLYEMEIEKIALPVLNEIEIKSFDIILQEVSFYYNFEKYIFSHLNLRIKEGDKIEIVGNSGSGKTTLLKIIATLYTPAKGKIMLGNNFYSDYSLDSLRSIISYVDQKPFVTEGTLYENLVLGIDEFEIDKVWIEEIVYNFDLLNLDKNYGNDLNMYISENGNNLSGGQRQKIALARAIIKKPKILILDEATSNIDYTAKIKILTYLYSFDNISIITVSHDNSIKKFSNVRFHLTENLVCPEIELS